MIINWDCLVELAKLETESIDCCVTDCPYKIIAWWVRMVDRGDDCSWIFNRRKAVSDGTDCSNKWVKNNDKAVACAKNGSMFEYNSIKFSDWLPELYRVMKNWTHTYIMINSRNMFELQWAANKVWFKFQNQLIWAKNNKTPNKYYMQEYENILMLRKWPARSINNMGSSNIIKIPNIIWNKLHPSEKPVALMVHLIKNSTNPWDIVLDPFMWAGATIVWAKSCGRRFIGFEIDEAYYKITEDRLWK